MLRLQIFPRPWWLKTILFYFSLRLQSYHIPVRAMTRLMHRWVLRLCGLLHKGKEHFKCLALFFTLYWSEHEHGEKKMQPLSEQNVELLQGIADSSHWAGAFNLAAKLYLPASATAMRAKSALPCGQSGRRKATGIINVLVCFLLLQQNNTG